MFGPHVHRASSGARAGLATHVAAARAAAAKAGVEMRAAQVYVAGPQSLKITLRPEEVVELRDYLERSQIFVIAHGTYLDIPWSSRGVHLSKFIREEAALCASAGIAGLVIHLGVPGPEVVVASLGALLEPDSAPADASAVIYLEVPHVKAERSHYETPAKLAELFRQIRDKVDPSLCRFGLCIDTAHLWSCGVDLGSRASASAWLAGLEAVADVIPPDRIVFHLNDNLCAKGSGGDKHAPFFQGEIWRDFAGRPKDSGLAAFVEYAARRKIPTILERNAPAKSSAKAAREITAAMLASDYNVLFDLTDACRVAADAAADVAGPSARF